MVNNNGWNKKTVGGARWSTTMGGTRKLELELDGQQQWVERENWRWSSMVNNNGWNKKTGGGARWSTTMGGTRKL